MDLPVPPDIDIAQSVRPRPIIEVAGDLGLTADDLDLYGKYKAKLPLEIASRPARGRLVLVTAINPTPAGEGKSTVGVGLAQALCRIGTNAILTMREPSLGPVFGIKGGAAGGGYSQVIPMEDINLHFTGDFHAISSAHGLLSAMMDNHLQQGNAMRLDPRRISWPRTIDMNDRALRSAVIGLGGHANGVAREERWGCRCFQERNERIVTKLGADRGLRDCPCKELVGGGRIAIDQFGDPLAIRPPDRRVRPNRI